MPFTYAGLYSDNVVTTSGRPAVLVAVTVKPADSESLATLYTDRTKATQAANPVTTDVNGNLVFYADPGRYDCTTAGGGSFRVVVAADAADIETDADASAALAAHEADSTSVHGVADTGLLETQTGATAKVAAHAAAADPHGDRAYADTGLAGKASATDAVVTASAVDTRAMSVRALAGATPPSGAVWDVQDHSGAVLAEITAGSINCNVSPSSYSMVITGVRVYAGLTDPDPGAADGSVWIDTTAKAIKVRSGGVWA